MSSTPQRHRNKWGNAEVNRLHNEYEIKRLSIQEIAALHKRTFYSILYKLEDEGLVSSTWEGTRGTESDIEKESTGSGSETDSDMPSLIEGSSESDEESLPLDQYLYYLERKINRIDKFLEDKYGDEYF